MPKVQRKQPRLREGTVTFALEVVEVWEDSLFVTPEGEITIGKQVDMMVFGALEDAKCLRKLTIDLSALNHDES